MKFLGTIEDVVADYAKNENRNGVRLYIKLATFDDDLREQSVYARVQGRKAQQILDRMDEHGNVSGLWEAELSVSVYDYPGNGGRTIHANLVHVTGLELVDEELKPVPMVCPAPEGRTGIMNWVKTVFA